MHLGVHNLSETDDNQRISSTVSQVVINPDWDPYDANYGGDLALLVLSDEITFTTFIRPVCMPSDSTITDDIKGTIVGWGQTANETYEDIPRQAVVKVINDSACYLEDNFIAALSTSKTFCGGFKDGQPGYGDSGGGLFVLLDNNWMQYGVISSFRSSGSSHDISNSMTIYTNVSAYKRWIVEHVEETGGKVGEVAMQINLFCHFVFSDVPQYSCISDHLISQHENTFVASVTGSHKPKHSNEDVVILTIPNASMTSLPNRIGTFFANLKVLHVGPVSGLELIKRSNFGNMPHLVDLQIHDSEIHDFEPDSLWDLPNLELFQLRNSKLTSFDERYFQKSVKLKGINLNSNKLIEHLPKDLIQNNPLLIECIFSDNALRTIDEKFFIAQSELTSVDLSSNLLQHLPMNLFQNNTRLEYINLSKNRLEFLFEQFFANNSELNALDLSENSLSSLDAQMFHSNNKLRQVALSSNRFDHLPWNLFQQNLLLEKISLHGNLLTTLDEQLFKFNTILKQVDLTWNKLESIPSSLFESNTQLEVVYLQFNRLESLPSNLFASNSLLMEVYLRNNSLTEVDEDTFRTNVQLRKVSLAYNKIESLPGNLFNDNSLLEHLILSGNYFKAINDPFMERHRNLQIIDYGKNELESIPKDLLTNKTLLVDASFHHNKLKSIDEDLFSTNRKLQNVYLSFNQLEVLPKNLFRNNLLLTTISFGYNSITTLDERLFERNTKLKSIEATSNRLESLPKNLFENNLLLNVIVFNGNRLHSIETDFTQLRHVTHIQFANNMCINSTYYKSRSLARFQDKLRRKCSPSAV